jgi:hypothetical protein
MEEEILVRFEKNVAGDFYTTGECLACDAPENEARDLLAPLEDDNFDTYFIKQPKTAEEIERACRAIEVCCVEALRYGGTNPKIIHRLGNRPEYCDHLLTNDLFPPSDELTEQCNNANSEKPRWWQFWK